MSRTRLIGVGLHFKRSLACSLTIFILIHFPLICVLRLYYLFRIPFLLLLPSLLLSV